MILKLLKYDIRGIGRKLLPLYALVIVLSVLNKVNDIFVIQPMLNQTMSFYPQWVNSLSGILMGIYALSIVAIFFITFYILVTKYSRSIYGPEGYLTNTLPLTQSEIIVAKVLNFVLWGLVSTLVAALSFLIIAYNGTFAEQFGYLWREFASVFSIFWSQARAYNRVAFFLFLLAGLLTPVAEILNVYLCIGIGNKFKHKLASGIVAYLVINSVTSWVSTLVLAKVKNQMVFGPGMNSTYYTSMPNFQPFALVLLVLTLAQIAAYFLGTKYIQEKQLNLE